MTTEYPSHPALCAGPDPRHAGQDGVPRAAAMVPQPQPMDAPHSKAPLLFTFYYRNLQVHPKGCELQGLLLSTHL